MRHRSFALVLSGCLGLAAMACRPERGEPTEDSGSGGMGGKGSGGSAGGAGKGSGGVAGSGGTISSGGSAGGGAGNGGSPGTGGEIGSGGSGSGGSSGTGGRVGTGGRGSGGTAGSGGSAGSGGAGGAAGSGGAAGGGAGGKGGGTGGGTGAGGSTGTSSCTFTQQATLSSKIATVGIVTWSTTLANVTEAFIDFGLTTSYGYTAPVDLKAQNYRTLLLGMKPTKTYNYRIRARSSGGECASPNYTITTGSLLNGLSKITVSTKSTASPLYGGFLLAGQFASGGVSSGSPAYILDSDGDYVWAVTTGGDASGVKMDYSGTHIWINSVNVTMGMSGGSANVHRISMDGLTDENLSSKFTGQNHQLTVLPDETVAFYAYGSNGCEDIKEYSPSSGNVKTIANAGTAQGGASACHTNNIQYSKEDDTLVFSELDNQVVVKVKRSDGSTVWVMNGGKSTFSGDTWKGGQHGIHILGLDRLLLFNNNSKVNMGGGGSGSGSGDGSGSIAMELTLDLSAKKMTKAWSYKASPGIDNQIMGDLQRLPNGNTLMAYSTKGVLHEVSASGTLLQEWSWAVGGQFGYIEKRASLYGPPPR